MASDHIPTNRPTAAPAPETGQPSHVPRHLGLALIVIATAQLMIVLDATIVNVALPHIQESLGFSGSGLQWIVTGYALAFGSLLLLGGRLGDIFGRRRIFIAGIALFSLGSLLGGFATEQWWLLIARAVQGAGGALAAPTALALIATTFPSQYNAYSPNILRAVIAPASAVCSMMKVMKSEPVAIQAAPTMASIASESLVLL